MKEGAKVKVVASISGHEFTIGEIVSRKFLEYDGDGGSLGFHSETWGYWYMNPDEYEIVDEHCAIEKDQLADFLMWLKYDKEYYIVRYLGESIFDDFHETIDIQEVMNEYLKTVKEE